MELLWCDTEKGGPRQSEGRNHSAVKFLHRDTEEGGRAGKRRLRSQVRAGLHSRPVPRTLHPRGFLPHAPTQRAQGFTQM